MSGCGIGDVDVIVEEEEEVDIIVEEDEEDNDDDGFDDFFDFMVSGSEAFERETDGKSS